MLDLLYILQLAVGCLMILAFGIWLFFNYRWRDASGQVEADQKSQLDRSLRLILLLLVLPNFILIILTRTLS